MNLVVPFYHHGIYIGGKAVTDYNDKSKINRITLLQFKAGKSLFRVTNTERPKPLKQEEVVKRASEVFETLTDFGGYHVKRNNCEHFATYCKYGVRFRCRSMTQWKLRKPALDSPDLCFTPALVSNHDRVHHDTKLRHSVDGQPISCNKSMSPMAENV